jgi:hypothetical protein
METRRKKEKEAAFHHDYSEFSERINGLANQEREDVSEALHKIGRSGAPFVVTSD